MATSSGSSKADTAASSTPGSSCVLSLSYSVSDAGPESEGLPGEALELYLSEPVVCDFLPLTQMTPRAARDF